MDWRPHRRNPADQMERMKLSTSGISPTRVDYQLRSMEESNTALTSRLSLIEGTVKTQESQLHDMFSQLRNARGDNKNLQNVAIRANTDIENIRRQAEAERNNMAAEYTRQLHMLTEQKQRELSEQRNSMVQQFKEEEHSQMVNHKSELEQAQRQSNDVKARELSVQADKARRDKESLKQDLNQRHALELQKTIQEYEGSLTAVKKELGATKATVIQKENEHALKMKALQAEIAKRDQMIAQLKHEAAKQQATLAQLLASMEDQTAELVQLKSETKRNIRLFLEDQLHEKTERRMDAVRVDHEHKLEELVKHTDDTDTYNKHLTELQMRFSEAEERYENRDSLQQDLDEIERLRACLHEEGEKNAALNMQVQTLTEQLEEYNVTPEPQQDGQAHQYPPQANIPSHIQQSNNGYYPGSPMRGCHPQQPYYNGMSGVEGEFYQSGVRDDHYKCDENLIQQLQYDQHVGPHGRYPMAQPHMQHMRGIHHMPLQPTPRHTVQHHVDPASQQPVAVIHPTDTDACTEQRELNIEQQDQLQRQKQQQKQQQQHRDQFDSPSSPGMQSHNMTQTSTGDTFAPGITSHTTYCKAPVIIGDFITFPDETDAGGVGVLSDEINRSDDASTIQATSVQQQPGGSLDCPQETSEDLHVMTSQTTDTLLDDTDQPGSQVDEEHFKQMDALQKTIIELEERNRSQAETNRQQIEALNQEKESLETRLTNTNEELANVQQGLNKQITELTTKKTQLDDALSCVIAKSEDREKEIQENILTIKEDNAAHENARAQAITALQQELTKQREVQQLQETNFQELMAKITTWEAEDSTLKQQVDDLETEKKQLEQELTSWKSKSEDMDETWQIRLREIKTQNKKQQTAMAEEIADLKGAIKREAEEEVTSWKTKCEDMEKQWQFRFREIEAQHKKEQTSKTEEIADLRRASIYINEENQKRDNMIHQLKMKIKDLEQKETYGEVVKRNLITLEEENEKMKSDVIHLKMTEGKIQELNAEINSLRSELKSLRTAQSEDKQLHEQYQATHNKQTEDLNRIITEKEHELMEQRNINDTLQKEVEHLKTRTNKEKPLEINEAFDTNTLNSQFPEKGGDVEKETISDAESTVHIPNNLSSASHNRNADDLDQDIDVMESTLTYTEDDSNETEIKPCQANNKCVSSDSEEENEPLPAQESAVQGPTDTNDGLTKDLQAFKLEIDDTSGENIETESNRFRKSEDVLSETHPPLSADKRSQGNVNDTTGRTLSSAADNMVKTVNDDIIIHTKTPGHVENTSITDGSGKTDNTSVSEKIQDLDDDVAKSDQTHGENNAVKETSPDQDVGKSPTIDATQGDNSSIADNSEKKDNQNDSDNVQGVDDNIAKIDQLQVEGIAVDETSSDKVEAKSSNNDDSKLVDVHIKNPELIYYKSIAQSYSEKDQFIDDTFKNEDQTQEEVTTVENNSTRQDEVESLTNDDSKLFDFHSKPPKHVENSNADERPQHLLDDNISPESKQMLKATDKTTRTNTSITIKSDKKDEYSEYVSCNSGEQLSGSNARDQGENTLPSAAEYKGKTDTTTDSETLMNADETAIVEEPKQFATQTDNKENDVQGLQEHIKNDSGDKQEDCEILMDTSGHVENLNQETMDEQPADIDIKPEAEIKSSLTVKSKDIHISQPCTNDDADETQNWKSVHADKIYNLGVSRVEGNSINDMQRTQTSSTDASEKIVTEKDPLSGSISNEEHGASSTPKFVLKNNVSSSSTVLSSTNSNDEAFKCLSDASKHPMKLNKDKFEHVNVKSDSERKQSVKTQPQEMAENMTSVGSTDNDNAQISQLNDDKKFENMAIGRDKQKCNFGSENEEMPPHSTVDEDKEEKKELSRNAHFVTAPGEKETGSSSFVDDEDEGTGRAECVKLEKEQGAGKIDNQDAFDESERKTFSTSFTKEDATDSSASGRNKSDTDSEKDKKKPSGQPKSKQSKRGKSNSKKPLFYFFNF